MSGFNQLYGMFERQFEADQGQFLYRFRSRGEGYRVSEDERDQMVSSFKWSIRLAGAALMAVMLVVIFAPLLVLSDSALPTNNALVWIWIIAAIGLGIIPYYFIQRRAWRAPLRELEGRPISAPALTNEEARKLGFARMSYAHLAMAPFLSLLILWQPRHQPDLFHGTGRLLWLVPIAFTSLAGIQAYRKWRFENG